MNPRRWGVSSPFNTELTTAMNKEIYQAHEADDQIDQASAAQMRRFHRVEALKMLGVIVGGLALIVIALFIFGLFVK